MEVLIITLMLTGMALLVMAVAFYRLLWSVLQTHRRAMDSLHQRIERERLAEARPAAAPPATGSPKSADPRTWERW